jgi:hypothetical protein
MAQGSASAVRRRCLVAALLAATAAAVALPAGGALAGPGYDLPDLVADAPARTGGTSFTLDDNAFTVTSTVVGRTYTATVWIRAGSTASVGRTAQLKLRERTSAGAQVADAGSPLVTLTTGWQMFTVSRTTTTAGGNLGVRVSHNAAVAGAILEADAFTLTASGP